MIPDAHHHLKQASSQADQKKIAEPADHDQLCGEVFLLSQQQPYFGPLASQSTLDAYIGTAAEMPAVMHEIGRLRETCFRAIGEGSGNSLDIEIYDEHYLHLFLWDRELKCIAGAYRLGCSDRIIAEHGSKGLISSSYFEFEQPFIDFLNPGLELGRAFVAPTHQKSIFALALLWKAILAFVSENPQYSKLFGTVSISDDYTHISQDLIVKYMRKSHLNQTINKWIKPNNPYQEIPDNYDNISPFLNNIEQISAKIAETEPDGKSIPVLLRQYLKLNATLLEFNVDPNFCNSLDALVLVDIHQAPATIMSYYMGKERYAKFKQSV